MEARSSRLLRYYYNIDEIAVCKPRYMEKAVFDMDKIRMIALVSGADAACPLLGDRAEAGRRSNGAVFCSASTRRQF